MKSNAYAIASVAAALVLGGTAFAAEPISLDQARAAALENSAAVHQATLAVATAVNGQKSAWIDFLPTLSAGGSVKGSVQEPNFEFTEYSGSISLKQNLFSGGTRVAALDGAATARAAAEEKLRASRLDAIAKLDDAYLAALESARNKETKRADLAASALSLELAKAKKEAGNLSESDFLKTQSTYATKKAVSVSADFAAASNLKKLEALIGRPAAPLTLDDAAFADLASAIVEAAAADLDGFVESLYRKSVQTNPNLRQKELAVAQSDVALRKKTAAFFPSISGDISYGAKAAELEQLEWRTSFSLSASVPLFPIVDTVIDRANAAIDKETAESARAAAYDDLRLSFYTTTIAVLSAAGQIESAEAALAFAERNHEAAIERFKLSALTLSGVADAEATLAEARSSAVKTRFEWYKAVIDLVHLMGFEREEDLRAAIQ